MTLWQHLRYDLSVQEYYLVALAQQRPEDEPSLDMKSAVSTAMNKLVNSLCCSYKSLPSDVDGAIHFTQRHTISCAGLISEPAQLHAGTQKY